MPGKIPQYLYNKRAVVYQKIVTSDGAGGQTESLMIRHQSVPCRLVSPDGQRQLLYAALKVPVTLVCIMDWRPMFDSDIILVEGVQYNIEMLKDPSFSHHHWEIDLRVLRPAMVPGG